MILSIDGGTGDDLIIGGAGSDIMLGGTGDDVLHGDQRGVEHYRGSLQSGFVNIPEALHGNDAIFAGDGNDEVVAGGGNDYVQGGLGDDRLWGDDPLLSVTGDDQLYGGAGYDKIIGGGGDDLLDGGSGDDKIWGDHDASQEQYGDDEIYGRSGNDAIAAGQGADRVDGGAGNDSLLFGQEGKDTLLGGEGDDYLDAGEDNDIDLLDGGTGFDTFLAYGGDVIEDSDGVGVVHFKNRRLTGGYRLASDPENTYRDYNHSFIYQLDGSTLTVRDGEGVLTINNFTNNQLGLDLYSPAVTHTGGDGFETIGTTDGDVVVDRDGLSVVVHKGHILTGGNWLGSSSSGNSWGGTRRLSENRLPYCGCDKLV